MQPIALPSMSDPDALVAAHTALLAQASGRMFPADAAAQLGVSELELHVAYTGAGTTRLELDLKALWGDLASLGPVKAITRNRDAVLEVVGPWEGLELGPMHGLVLGGPIDLRLFPRRFAHAIAVEREQGGRMSRSIQFYGPDGVALHKVFLVEGSDVAAFHRYLARHRVEAPRTVAVEQPASALQPTAPATDRPAEVDRSKLEAEWRAMTDPHQYHGLLQRHRLTRRQAVDLVPKDLARPVAGSSLSAVLRGARTLEVPLMVFVGNSGCVQIHTGPLQRIQEARGWLNVLDPAVDLHVRSEALGALYAVRKPAEGGRWVSSLEVFAPDGELVLTVFGERKPGRDERAEWRELCRSLLPVDHPVDEERQL